MGQEVKQDLAVSTRLMLALQDMLEGEWEAMESTHGRIEIAMTGAFALIAFAGSFRGHEIFLVDMFGLLKYASECHVERDLRDLEFVIVPLLGRYKSED